MTTVRTRILDDPVDLFEVAGDTGWVFARDGIGVAGRGLHRRVDASDATDVLGELGSDVIAIGARPFDPRKSWELIIPTYQVRVDADGVTRETIIDDGSTSRVDLESSPSGHAIGAVELVPVDDPQSWCGSVHLATEMIKSGRIDKVVLSREVTAICATPISAHTLATRLSDQFGHCYVFSVDGLVGASPELLVRRQGELVESLPMAGTTRRDPDPDRDAQLRQALFESPTYRHEHQLTIDMVHETLLAFTSFLDDEPEPRVVSLANVAHLATRVVGELSRPCASVLELQGALHPTPAVSGRPRAAALEVIGELETRDRDRYGGTVGWVDGAGNGTWAVSIRCAQIDPADSHRARLHAGCGIVADSHPATELTESQAKLRAVASVLED